MKHTNILIVILILFNSCSKEEASSGEPAQVYISGAVASPTASESVTVKNNSGGTIDLTGWTIGDINSPSAYSIPGGNSLNHGASVTFAASTMGFQINDSGETIYLKNANGATVDTWTN